MVIADASGQLPGRIPRIGIFRFPVQRENSPVVHSEMPAAVAVRHLFPAGIVQMPRDNRNIGIEKRGCRSGLLGGKIERIVLQFLIFHRLRQTVHDGVATESVPVHVAGEDDARIRTVHAGSAPGLAERNGGVILPQPVPVPFHQIPPTEPLALRQRKLQQLHVECRHVSFHGGTVTETAPAGEPCAFPSRRFDMKRRNQPAGVGAGPAVKGFTFCNAVELSRSLKDIQRFPAAFIHQQPAVHQAERLVGEMVFPPLVGDGAFADDAVVLGDQLLLAVGPQRDAIQQIGSFQPVTQQFPLSETERAEFGHQRAFLQRVTSGNRTLSR